MTSSPRGPALTGFAAAARWSGPAPTWQAEDAVTLTMTAPARTDRFHDPATTGRQADSPAWLTPVEAPATLVARVEVGFVDTFDAGVLMVYEGPDTWAKLCFERAPDGRRMVVSVVTRGRSDDANGFVVADASVWLRISALPRAYAFHASTDGRRWELVRYFVLGSRGRRRLGLSVQAPVGPGCRATFRDLSLRPGVVDDIRSGD
jgi:uncharacterized protein